MRAHGRTGLHTSFLDSNLEAFLDAAPDAVVVVDTTDRIVAVNALTETMFGYGRDEVIGQPFAMLVPSPESGRRRNGDPFAIQLRSSRIETDRGTLFTQIIRDLSEIQASLHEKEVLLREIHHRVKNNLQITSSLLRLQARSIDDPRARELFDSTQSRIRSIALVHEKLYQSTNLAAIDFADYLRTLADLLLRSYTAASSAIELRVNAEPLPLSVETAVPCGLIANELLSNAIKHAFPQGTGTIEVTLAQSEGMADLVIADNGVGLPESVGFEGHDTLGLQLVRQLATQIDAAIDIDRTHGTRFRIVFPLTRGANA